MLTSVPGVPNHFVSILPCHQWFRELENPVHRKPMNKSEIKREYEITGRANKSLKLISSIEELFPINYLIMNRKAFAQNLREMPYAWWRALAINLNENPPSQRTIEYVVFYFRNIRPSSWRTKQSLLFERLTLFYRRIIRILDNILETK